MLLVASPWTGCLSGDPANPNIAVHKMLVSERDDGNFTVYVHSQFGEHMYDWIDVRIDNVSVANRSEVFAWEGTIPANGVFVEIVANSGESLYATAVRIDFDPLDDRVLVAVLDPKDGWSNARDYGLPYGRILQRRSADA